MTSRAPDRSFVAVLLSLLALVGAIVVASPAAASVAGDEAVLTSELNRLRLSRGLPALVTDARLVEVARNWSAQMAGANALAHNAKLGAEAPTGTFLKENVGYGASPLAVHTGFLESPSHYGVMTAAGPTAVGVGTLRVNGVLWVTEVLLRPDSLVPVVATSSSVGVDGYRTVLHDGSVATFGAAPAFSAAPPSPHPVVGGAATATGDGYWLVDAGGAVTARGDARPLGGVSDRGLSAPIVALAATPSGGGYWLLGRDGGVFTFGDAGYFGSTGDLRLNSPVVAMASTPSGRGYWFVAADGGIFSFGDAAFHGSTGAFPLNQPVVGMASTASGLGYWLVARDGGIFTFGDAAFLGSAGELQLARPIVGMAATASGAGYRFVAADGGIFTYGDAPFLGSLGGTRVAASTVAVLAA